METSLQDIKRVYDIAEYHHLCNNFHYFLRRVFETLNPGTIFIDNWHLHLLTDILEAVAKRELKRIIINVPPRSLKSTIVSVAFPAWLLAKYPTERIIVSSYTQMLSTKHSVDCRKILRSTWFKKLFIHSHIAPGNNTKNRFSTMANGYRFATSVGGSITGDGGNFLIIDDPHNPTKIAYPGDRERVADWFQNTLTSRIDDKKNGVIILVMQRLHCEDLTGFLLKNQPKLWHHVALKAYNETCVDIIFKNKLYKRIAAEELLHASREDHESLQRLRLELGHYAFAAQYQQEPTTKMNQLVSAENFHYYEELPSLDSIVISVDCAVNFDDKSDYSAIAIMGIKGETSYLIAMHQIKMHYTDLRNSLLHLIATYKPNSILVENRAHGTAVLQELQRQTKIRVISITPKLNKNARFAYLAIAIENGTILLPKSALFVSNLITEIIQFPHGRHDDQVDALSQYMEWLSRYKNHTSKPRIRQI